MVFIHGGAFNFGSASPDFYSPDYLLDENVIIVTFNYRLNALGKRTYISLIFGIIFIIKLYSTLKWFEYIFL